MLWVKADSREVLTSDFVNIAYLLNLPEMNEQDQNQIVTKVRRWLQSHTGWLLIFDNADQPEELTEIIPQGPGHVLITSRNHRWEGVVDTVAVDVFTRKESVEFLNKRVPRAINKGEADRLAHELGDLPLALEQASRADLV